MAFRRHLRQRILEKRGLGLFGPQKAQQISKLKASHRVICVDNTVPPAHALPCANYGTERLSAQRYRAGRNLGL